MCGITGAAWTESGRAISSQLLGQMTDALVHRGPDDTGYFFDDGAPDPDDPGIGLGFRRLSIIDLETGQQPVGNEDNSIQVVLNGETILDCDLSKLGKTMGPITKFKGRLRTEGHFGFAGHGAAVQFRNISIKELN